MTIDAKTDDRKTAKAVVEKPGGKVSDQAVLTTPVIIKLEKTSRKKKKYTKGTKGVQRLLLGLSKATYRSANALAKGTRTFSRKSNRSGRKKRDGLIRDSLRNASSGIRVDLNELGRAPDEIAKRIGTRQIVRVFRVFTPFGN